MNLHKNTARRQARLMRPCLLASAIGLALVANSAQAIDLSTDEVSIRLDTTISYGSGMRVSGRDDDLIAKSHFNPLIVQAPLEQQILAPGRFSANSDDGNLNFDNGDFIFNAARITSELQVDYKNYGFFVRGNYFYDFTLNDMDELSDGAKDFAGSRGRLLDAYAYKDFDIGERMLSVRLGRQVVSWGESTFLAGGINTINPVDLTALRTAGAELKEAFLPQNMLWGSIDLTPNMSMEGVVLFEWDPVEAEPVGTYFATNDFATAGGRYAMLNFGLVPQPVRNADLFDPVCAGGNFGASDAPLPPTLVALGCSAAFPRGSNIEPDANGFDGQWGLAFRYFAPQLNDTEFGLYYLRYHSRLPLLSGQAVLNSNVSTGAVLVEYPEDIDLFGLSFNTTIPGGWSLAGELSYRDNVPIQIDDVELLFAGLSPLNAAIPNEYERFRSQLGSYAPGEYIPGYERRKASQFQFTLTKLIGPNNWIGADQVAVVGEFGATNYWNLPSHDELRFEGPGTDTGGGPSRLTGAARNPVTTPDGFATSFSWGYRLVVAPTYNAVFGTSWNMTPRVAFNHDVQGVTPGPGGNFIEGRKQVTLGVNFSRLSTWQFGFAYTNFFGAGINNLLSDRDFVSASISYSF
ncbi:DUF1302 domain-containing protein [Wenzhouxiangella marina]|uniref:Uncharacterized protein n=1 Tax=Wenzhouxiangella marina TaxID=1579979 RepID=A0A0K0XZ44_9GAMM|nr:DUF1302 domain-containing protein [Wenzhouxiangella marina]AKS42958.1 hypothetical protein WM2015_2600 [Wenzhouxiangella marina]MBB6087358.1 hypothetical protein [Wenzhouxiangella marina]